MILLRIPLLIACATAFLAVVVLFPEYGQALGPAKEFGLSREEAETEAQRAARTAPSAPSLGNIGGKQTISSKSIAALHDVSANRDDLHQRMMDLQEELDKVKLMEGSEGKATMTEASLRETRNEMSSIREKVLDSIVLQRALQMSRETPTISGDPRSPVRPQREQQQRRQRLQPEHSALSSQMMAPPLLWSLPGSEYSVPSSQMEPLLRPLGDDPPHLYFPHVPQPRKSLVSKLCSFCMSDDAEPAQSLPGLNDEDNRAMYMQRQRLARNGYNTFAEGGGGSI